MALNNRVTLAPALSTGTGNFAAANLWGGRRIAIQFVVEAAGATPTVTYTIQGSNDGSTWTNLAYVTEDATAASTAAAITLTAVGSKTVFIDGLDKRFFDQIRIAVSANTNITFHADAIRTAQDA